jgi:hypothetical protein
MSVELGVWVEKLESFVCDFNCYYTIKLLLLLIRVLRNRQIKNTKNKNLKK